MHSLSHFFSHLRAWSPPGLRSFLANLAKIVQNALPLAIRSVNTVTDFKGKLKTFLFSAKAFLLKSD